MGILDFTLNAGRGFYSKKKQNRWEGQLLDPSDHYN